MRIPWRSRRRLQRARDQAGTILTDTVRALTLGHYTEATTYNDQTNHSCIVHAFDIAIADADRHCGKRLRMAAPGARSTHDDRHRPSPPHDRGIHTACRVRR